MNAPVSIECNPLTERTPPNERGWRLTAFLVWIAGVALRIYPSGSTRLGFDENLYRTYVLAVQKAGLGGYPQIVEGYIAYQKQLPASILPPMRFIYIFCGYVWVQLFGGDTLAALHNVACAFSILSLTVAFIFALRMGGKAAGLATLALMACAPTQIHMSQHAFVDGVFGFWALLVVWVLWENLRSPNDLRWLCPYAGALAVMVMTKENAAFVFVAVVGILIVNRWVKFGQITPRLLIATVAGPCIGVLLLVSLAGGPANFIETYYLSVTKNMVLPYAIATGDGPWYRYLVDLLLVSPLILVLAIGEVFKLRLQKKAEIYLVAFICFSYLLMANVKYGMNLRYAIMWDMPLRFLAFANVSSLADYFGKRRDLMFAVGIVALCAFDLHQYYILFDRTQGSLYEPITEELMRVTNILKPLPH